MPRISSCIDEYENAKLNTGQMFFIMLSFIPLALFFPFWVVAKFIYEPWLKRLTEMRDEIPPIPFRERWPINKAKNTNKQVNKNSVVYENTPKGNVIMRYSYDDEVFEYWCDNKTLLYKDLDVVARKYVIVYSCKDLYIDRFELQKQKFIEARNKYLAEIKGRKEEEIKEDNKEDSLFIKSKMQKAKENNTNYMDGNLVNINKLTTVEKANSFKRLGNFNECTVWKPEANKTQVKEPISNLSFSAFKNKFWTNKND